MKRHLSLLLALIMVFTLMPHALALDNTGQAVPSESGVFNANGDTSTALAREELDAAYSPDRTEYDAELTHKAGEAVPEKYYSDTAISLWGEDQGFIIPIDDSSPMSIDLNIEPNDDIDNTMYAFKYQYGSSNNWISFKPENPEQFEDISGQVEPGGAMIRCAAYCDGRIFGVARYGNSYYFCEIDQTTYEARPIAQYGGQLFDMAFDPTTSTLYGIYYGLLKIDLKTGNLTRVASLSENARALAFSPDGRLYCMSTSPAVLYEISKETWTARGLGLMRITPSQDFACLAFGNDGVLYCCSNTRENSENGVSLYSVNTNSAIATYIGGTDGFLTGMYVKPSQSTADVLGVSIDPQSVLLNPGDQKQFTATVHPWNTVNRDVIWSSSDDSVAVVDENGLVTATGAGETLITVTTAVGGFSASAEVKIEDKKIIEYTGNIIGASYFEGEMNWVSFDPNTGEMAVYDEFIDWTNNDGTTWTSIYYKGYIYSYIGYVMGGVIPGELAKFDAETGELLELISGVGPIYSMAYDETTETVYALTGTGPSTRALATLDLATGATTHIAYLNREETGGTPMAIASVNGTLYTIMHKTGGLYTIDKDDGSLIYIADTNLDPSWPVSMAYDEVADALYIYSDFAGWSSSYLCRVDYKTGAIDALIELENDFHGLLVMPLTNEHVNVNGVSIPSSLSMGLYEESSLSAQIMPENATDRRIIWTTSDDHIVSVDIYGNIKATGTGTATVTATSHDGGFNANCTVTVTGEFENLEYDGAVYGYVTTAADTVRPRQTGLFRFDLDNNTVVNVESDIDVEHVSAAAINYEDGFVYGFTRDGGFFRATADGKLLNYYFNGYLEVISLTYDCSTHSLYVLTVGYDDTEGIYKVDMRTGKLELIGKLDFTESNSVLVYTMAADNKGRLIGINGKGDLYEIDKNNAGMTLLHSNAGQFSRVEYAQGLCFDPIADCFYWGFYGILPYGDYNLETAIYRIDAQTYELERVASKTGLIRGIYTVMGDSDIVPVEGIGFAEDEINLMQYGVHNLEAEFLPANSTNRAVFYESSDESVATVDANGRVVAMGLGTATITATTADGGFTASIKVNVSEYTWRPDGLLHGYVTVHTDSSYTLGWYGYDLNTYSGEFLGNDYGGKVTAAAFNMDNGLIYGYFEGNTFFVASTEGVLYTKKVETYADDMAYDITTNTMYAIKGTYMPDYSVYDALYTVNLETGALENEVAIDTINGSATTLGITNDGKLYTVCEDAGLYRLSREGRLTYIGATGLPGANYLQSMTYDPIAETMYWSGFYYEAFSELPPINDLYSIDLDTGATTRQIYNTGEITGLYTITPMGFDPNVSCTVTFVDGVTGETLRTDTVIKGLDASAPEAPVHEGYTFMGWDRDFTNVQEDITVTALYDRITAHRVEVGNVNATPGSRVLVPVSMDELSSAAFTIEYDAEALTYITHTNPSDNAYIVVNDQVAGALRIAVVNPTLNYNGECLSLEFAVKDNASGEVELAISVDSAAVIMDGITLDVSAEDINAVSGSISIVTNYTVTFNYMVNGEWVSESQTVDAGNAAIAPEALPQEHSVTQYIFIGWNIGFDSVYSDLEVTAEYGLLGDVTRDGELNITDALLIMRNVAGTESFSELQERLGDANLSGNVEIGDALYLMRLITGMETFNG